MKTLIIISTLLFSFMSFDILSQQEDIGRYIVMNATKNGINISDVAHDQNQFIVFYTLENDTRIFMANYWSKNESQSFGPIHALKTINFEETEDKHKYDLITFKWDFRNTYDTKEGVASVQLMKIYKPYSITFEMKIINQELDVLVYTGYMDETDN